MKKLIIIILLLQAFHTFAAMKVYYFAANGNDANTGLTTGSPFKSAAKFNSLQSSLNAGDEVRFNRGDTFYGSFIISKSGSSGSPIIYGAYGTGANPIITGFTSVTSWTNLTGNIWESTTAISTLPTMNMVTINGVNTAMGRYPNSGWLTYGSYTNTSINSSSLNSAVTNWTGAQVVLFVNRFTLARNPITAASGSNLTFTSTTLDPNLNGNNKNFFIQNDVRTLDTQNEWYYNPSTKKIRIYSTSSPTGVQVSTVDTLVYLPNNKNYITFQNIDFTGSNKASVEILNASHITFDNCNFSFAGQAAVHNSFGGAATGNTWTNCTFIDINGTALDASGDMDAVTVTGSRFNNIGITPGMGEVLGVGYKGIETIGANSVFTHNILDGIGYVGIEFRGSNSRVDSNYINGACGVLSDGGAIYTYNGSNATFTGRSVKNNIITNSPNAVGIYMDDLANGVAISNNTVSGCESGLYLHGTTNIQATNNTLFNNSQTQLLLGDESNEPFSTLTITGNKLIAYTNSQQAAMFLVYTNYVSSLGTINNNCYARPTNDNLTIYVQIARPLPVTASNFNLAMWETFSSQDANSNKSPIALTNVNQFFSAYNATDHDSTIILPSGTWIDMTNVTYNTGSTILHAYSSVVLLNTGNNVAPIADAGTNKNITLPTSTITQVGSGTDADGTIASYTWTQVSGAAMATIVSPNSATTVINGLSVAGNYVFQLRVTDNFGLAATDTMSVVVNTSAPVNLPPVVNAGGNKNITLPTSSLTQSGSATDPDGTIASYAWTQGSNPTTATIASPTSAVTVISGMTVAGTYSFTFTATDNLGATGSQTITIIVNTAAPIAPVANAGTDKSITWPSNSVNLTGSGTDADGTIVGYNWSKISGANATIANPNSQNTGVTFPQVGTYVFQLQVTDNSGLTGTDNVTITVNKGTVSISFSAPTLTQTWTGLPLAPTVNTTPAGVAYSILYNGIGATPIEPNSYTTTAATTDGNYVLATVSGTFTINKAIATFNISGTSVYFNNNSQQPFVTTNPANLTGVSIVSPHTNPGIYSVTVSLNNSHYQATDVVTPFTITTAGASMTITDYQNKFYTSGQISVVPVTNPAGLTYSLTYNGSATPPTNAGTYQVIATITQVGYSGADTVNLVIQKAETTNTLTWNPIANVQEGTALTSLQLNAYSSVAGTFTYDFPAGYILSAGVYRITGTFHPTDSANYNTSTIQNTLIVYGSPILQILIIHGKPYPLDYPQ